MISTSTIPIVKARLFELITEALKTAGPDGNPVQVCYGQPQTEQRECIIVAELAAPGDQDWMTLGALKRDEAYGIRSIIRVHDPKNDTQQKATERAFEILALVEDPIRLDPTLGLTRLQRIQYLECDVTLADFAEAPNPDGAGYWAELTWVLRVVRARIGGNT